MSVNCGNLSSLNKWDEIKKVILSGEGDIEAKTDYAHDDSSMGYTTFLWAAYYNMSEMCSWLIQHGANVFAMDKNSKTALHIAAKYGSATVVRQLLMEGVDPDQRDYWGRVPAQLTSDRRGVCIHSGKQLTKADLKEVETVFKFWPSIKDIYDRKGIAGLESLADIGGEMGDEALCYVELENKFKGASLAKAPSPEKSAPLVEAHVPTVKDGNQESLKEVPGEPDIFVSYCWAEKDLVRKLAEDLKGKGYNIWIDIGQMGGGDELYAEIDRGLRSAKVIVASVSPRYAQSVNCRREISLASDLKKPIVPIIVHQKSIEQWPPIGPMGFLLTGKLYCDMVGEYSSGFEQLVEAVSKML